MTPSYCLIRNLPIWKFSYKGTHSKPIRTTVAVTEVKGDLVKGYMLRRGNTVFGRLQDAPIRCFKKSEIAPAKNGNKTVRKQTLADLIVEGA
jgi:hypothetical protein